MPRPTILSFQVIAALAIGLAFGVGGFTFFYAKGNAYLTNDPKACANCHVMQSYYDSWNKAPHHNVAVCNDCHTPDNLLGKYFTKAINGFNHSLKFTTGDYPEHLRANSMNQKITQNACSKCHAVMIAEIHHGRGTDQVQPPCVQCHREVGHAF